MKTILIVGCDKLTIPILDICRQKNLRIIITDKNINEVNQKYADVFFQVNGLEKEKILEICKNNNVDGILTLGEDRLQTIAYVSENMNIPGITRMTAIYSQNKFLLREKMKQNGIPVPFYCIVRNKEELNKLNIEEIKFPVVVKPIDATGGRGVIKVNDEFSLERALEESLESSKNGVAMIEEYLSGQEYSVETLTQNGTTYIVSITEKTTSGDPYFVETRHIVPAKLNDVDRKKIEEVTLRTLQAIGVRNNGSHTEVKLTDKGAIVVETAARLGADFITSKLVPLATGVNMYENIVNIALGEKIKIDKTNNYIAGIQYVIPSNYKLFCDNYTSIVNNKDLVKLKKLCDVSEKPLLRSNVDRLAYYICRSNSREELLHMLNLVEDKTEM